MKIFCIIPAFNEAQSIQTVISKVKPLVDEIVVVDDNSKDNTADLAREAGAVVLQHIINRDQGASLQTGNEYALNNGADIIVHFDADDQFQAEEISDVIQPIINNEADIVFGSRFLGKESNMPWKKKYIIIPLGKLVNRYLFGIKTKLTDPQSGFRAMTRRVAEEIVIENDGKAHCSEILIKASRGKYKIKEVPITVVYHHFGQKFSGGFRIIKDIIYNKLNK
jgi:glycosyltransferase involved in cell wall biosynthesis